MPTPKVKPLVFEDEPRLGAGISRPLPKARTRNYKLLVIFSGSSPMRMTIVAESAARAKVYAGNRWPKAISIEVLK